MKHSNIAVEEIFSQLKIHRGGPPLIQETLVPIVSDHMFMPIQTMENGLMLLVEIDTIPFVRQLFSCIYLTTLSWWILRYYFGIIPWLNIHHPKSFCMI